ncbi:hypothetical protein V1512DRAFT_262431 [Lipomyces arxii]|uniref:uncharacterized protein n=1 Tax=Lipomyces arxii TaxID=56418 RepID=UPI0034CFC466
MAEDSVPVPVVEAEVAAAPEDRKLSMKQRIITHMNTDHVLSLKDYLIFYKGINPTRNVVMKDITEDHITIGFEIIHNKGIDVGEAVIDFNPPMNNLGEARDVLVGMAMQASEGLGYATVKPLDEFTPPTWKTAPIIVLILTGIYFVYWNPTAINNPESLLRAYKINDIEFIPVIIKTIFWVVILYHFIELGMIYIWTGMYRVPTLKRIGWCLCGFLEGFPALNRFRALMVEKDKASEKTKETVEKKE